MKSSCKYWKDSIAYNIENNFLWVNENDFGNTDDGYKTFKSVCLCVGEKPVAFQVHVFLKFKVIGKYIYDIKILGYDIPERFSHGISSENMNTLNSLINELIETEIKPLFQNNKKKIKYGKFC